MNKKIAYLTKSDIYGLPEYNGYINTNLKRIYKIYFIGENNSNKILVQKTSYGISITLPKQKSRLKFYFKTFFILMRVEPSLIHIFWFPLASIVPLLSKLTFQKFITIGDFRTKSPFGGIKGKVKDIVLKFESLFFHKRITLDEELANFIFKKNADCYIPMGYDSSLFYDYKLEKKYDFVYAGSISRERKVYRFIRDFDEITQHKFNFLIIGWGDEAKKVETLSNKFKNIEYMKKIDRDKVAMYYSMSKIGISFVDKSVLNIQQPTKILEYIACGNNILANDTVGTLELTSKLDFNGYIFKKIDELKNISLDNFEKFEGKDISSYSWQNIIDNKLIPFYERLLK